MLKQCVFSFVSLINITELRLKLQRHNVPALTKQEQAYQLLQTVVSVPAFRVNIEASKVVIAESK